MWLARFAEFFLSIERVIINKVFLIKQDLANT